MKFEMTGFYAGNTMKVNHIDFVNGKAEVKGELAKMGGVIAYLATYNAYPVGSDELAAAQERDSVNKGESNGMPEVLDRQSGSDTGGAPADITSPGTGSGVGATGASTDGTGGGPDGDGVPEGHSVDEGAPKGSPDSTVLKIIDGIKALDPSNDDHWTDAGLPRVDAVASASSVVNVTRKDINMAIPEWNREKAMAEV
jgi:hypothetical protein